MLNLVALLTLQASPPTLSDTFIAESARAILAIKEGSVAYRVAGDGHSQSVTDVMRGDRHHVATVVDGAPYIDDVITRTTDLMVIHPNHQYYETALDPKQTDFPLEPLPEPPPGEVKFDLRLDPQHGLVLRTKPAFTNPKVAQANGVETLTVEIANPKSPEKKILVKLNRDAKTKLPTTLITDRYGEQATIVIECVARKVKDEELTIPASAYAGYLKMDPPKSGSGTL